MLNPKDKKKWKEKRHDFDFIHTHITSQTLSEHYTVYTHAYSHILF